MLYLLVGPTGVGKSTLGNAAAAAIPNCKFYELDKLAAANAKMPTPEDVLRVHGPDAYWRICGRILQTIKLKHENSPEIAICAVGRNVINAARARIVLVNYPNCILIWASPEETYRRSDWWPDRPFREYVTLVHGTYARAVYEVIGERCKFDVTGLDKAAAIKAFVPWFKELIASTEEKPPEEP
jgi:shikimate kinase